MEVLKVRTNEYDALNCPMYGNEAEDLVHLTSCLMLQDAWKELEEHMNKKV
jgi:hypothetical protein